jgi:hypothetical protein
VRLVRAPHRLVQLATIAGSGGLVLLDQLVQHMLAADRREDDVAHDAVGPLDRGLGDTDQQAGLARDTAKVGQ